MQRDVAPRHLTITERRRPWREDLGPEWTSFPIARLRYTATDRSWTLYWRDRNLRFHIYDRLAPSRRVDKLLNEIDDDPPASSGLTDLPARGTAVHGASHARGACPLINRPKRWDAVVEPPSSLHGVRSDRRRHGSGSAPAG